MTRPLMLPDAMCAFIRSLPAPPAVTHPAHDGTWLEACDHIDTTTGPQAYPPPPAWLAARDAYISHVMACPLCVTSGPKVPRHCPEGTALRQQYDSTPYSHGPD
ncbi:hypothetical protein [Citrobacter braakii]|uniref:hypothetical protein n=1 Tax=Citrobacter braakii TaxID=57706 RepID=UPI002FFC5BE4